MKIKSIPKQKKIFEKYVDKNYIKGADEKALPRHMDKKLHSLLVLDEAMLIDACFTNYNESFRNLLALESLFHDIGRFEQWKVSGTHADTELSKSIPGMKDHGDLGAKVMDEHGLLKKLIPNVRIYDDEVRKVIAAHSKPDPISLPSTLEDYLNAFRSYDLQDLFLSDKASKEREILSATNTAIVKDADRLDIFRKIVKGIWCPMTTNDPIDPEVMKLYEQGKLPSIEELKAIGKWGPNIGHLIRLNFINQMTLVPVLMKIRRENLIDAVFRANGSPVLKDAYEIAKVKLDQMINKSDDGIVVSRR